MTEKIEVFKLLLSKEYYNIFRHRLDPEIFPEALEDLYESLIEAHATAKGDITARELYAMHCTRHKTLTEANKNVIVEIIRQINDVAVPDADIAEVLISRALVELKATRIARAALSIAQGNDEDFSEIQRLIDDNASAAEIEVVTSNIGDLLEDIQSTYKWEFNLPELNERVGKVGPEVFAILAGPVNSGKSLMGINFVFGPGGFAEQGAMCLYIGNEESLKRTMLRGISCYTGLTRKDLGNNIKAAQKDFDKIAGNIKVIDDISMTFSKLEYLTKRYKPDIIVIDMLDKVHVGGGFGKSHEKLALIAERAREHAKKFKCAVFGLSQTNGDTFGQLTIDQNQLAGSRVDKAANCDLILTLGSLPSSEEGNENFRRIYVAKSKLEGNGAKINCAIQPELSRLVP
jgi:archaellum biogenesis ATPase FlaH